MKRITQFIVISFICLLTTINVQAGPKAVVDNSSFDFGFAPQDSKLTHKYWIYSTGSEDLKITKVVPGCGCTKAPLEKDLIKSGDSTWLEIIFSSKKYKNKITKRPKFFTNTGQKTQRVSFTTEIVAPSDETFPLVIKPFKVNLSQLKNNDESVKFVLANHSEKDLTISIIEFDKENFDVVLPEIIKAGETVSGKILRRNYHNDKTFYKSLTIEVDDEHKTRFTIPVVYISNVMTQK